MYFSQSVVAAFIALAHYATAAPILVQDLDARTVIKGNDKNILVLGSAKGGDGGKNTANQGNFAAPIFLSKTNSGKTSQNVEQGNQAVQYADGGSAIVAGKLSSRDLEERTATFVKDNKGNTFVIGQSKGGNGGTNEANQGNFALPVFGAFKNSGKTTQDVQQVNGAGQSADGGSAVVAGRYARDFDEEELEARTLKITDNDRNTFVYGIATGGKGGKNTADQKNIAVPVVFAGTNSGKVKQDVAQGNLAEQSADGGGAAVVGKSSKRDGDLEARHGSLVYVGPVLSDNKDNTLVKGDSTGGKGGTNTANQINAAVPVAVVAGKNSGKVKQGVAQGNAAGQSANGGDAGVIGKQ